MFRRPIYELDLHGVSKDNHLTKVALQNSHRFANFNFLNSYSVAEPSAEELRMTRVREWAGEEEEGAGPGGAVVDIANNLSQNRNQAAALKQDFTPIIVVNPSQTYTSSSLPSGTI